MNNLEDIFSLTTLENNVSNQELDSCVPLKRAFLSGVSVVPVLVGLENLFFLSALFSYRRKLKQNNVYRYVASALTANFVISALSFYHFLNYYYGFESKEPNLWWALRKGLTLTLSLIMCGNIGLLIYGIDDNIYIVGRVSKPSHQSDKLSPRYKRRKANWLIAVVWALPILYGSLSMTPWNCTKNECTCTLQYESSKPICSGVKCSHLYTPMSKSYLFSVVLLLVLESFGLLFLLCKSIKKLKRSKINLNDRPESFCGSWNRIFKQYMGSHKVVFMLFGLFLFCTTPVIVLVMLDFAFPKLHLSHETINFVIPLPLVYCLISPLLMSYKLPKLRLAISFLMSTGCICKKKSKSSAAIKINSKNLTADGGLRSSVVSLV